MNPLELICVDEAQDLCSFDFDILHRIYPDTSFNYYGDYNQTMIAGYGMKEWSQLVTDGIKLYELKENYRNSLEIVQFCNKKYKTSMEGFGISSCEVKQICWKQLEDVKGELIDKEHKVAVIVKNHEIYLKFLRFIKCSEIQVVYIDMETDGPNDEQINVYSIFAVKGLEFSKVLIIEEGLNANEKYVAVTRGMKEVICCR